MPLVIKFVDAIPAGGGTPTVLLDLDNGPLRVGGPEQGLDLSPAPKRRIVASSMLADGDLISASAWGNRTLKIPVQLFGASIDAIGPQLQALSRELAKERNVLQVGVGAAAVYFKTYAAPDYAFDLRKHFNERGRAVLEIPADPFAIGPKETVGPITVYNDPVEGTTLNANPFFEVDASSWTALGGTFVRSTAQFHEGVASGLLTPDGVTATVEARSENVAATVGVQYRASAWVRCAVSRNVSVNINWRNSGGSLLSTSTATVAVTLNTWTFLELFATAPASTAQAQITVSMGSTPAAGHTLHVDEARLRQAGDVGGMCFDVSGVKGHVETPLIIRVTNTGSAPWNGGALVTAVATRSRGMVANTPAFLQSEAMTMGTDTSLQNNDASFSGAGQNWARTTFATQAAMADRLSIVRFPATSSVDARGEYIPWLRARKTVGGDTINVQLGYGYSDGGGANYFFDKVPIVDTNLQWWRLGGPIPIPAWWDPVYDGFGGQLAARGLSLLLRAERTGSGNLDWDCLALMPADERSCILDWPQVTGPDYWLVDGVNRLIWGQEGTSPAEVFSGSGSRAIADGDYPHVTPGETNRVFWMANAGDNQQDVLTHTTTLQYSYWPLYTWVVP